MKYPREVGQRIPNTRDQRLGYQDIVPEADGWFEVQKYLPLPYDLVIIDTGQRHIKGWWTGSCWDGFRINREMQPLRWRRTREIE